MSSTQEELEKMLRVMYVTAIQDADGTRAGRKDYRLRYDEVPEAYAREIMQLIDQARKEAARKAAIKELKEITKYPTAVIIDGHFEKKTLIYIKDIQDRIKALKEGK